MVRGDAKARQVERAAARAEEQGMAEGVVVPAQTERAMLESLWRIEGLLRRLCELLVNRSFSEGSTERGKE